MAPDTKTLDEIVESAIREVPPKFVPMVRDYTRRIAHILLEDRTAGIVPLTNAALRSIVEADASDMDAADVVLAFINMTDNVATILASLNPDLEKKLAEADSTDLAQNLGLASARAAQTTPRKTPRNIN